MKKRNTKEHVARHMLLQVVDKVSADSVYELLHPAVRTPCPLLADNSKTCGARSVLCHTHAAAENGFEWFSLRPEFAYSLNTPDRVGKQMRRAASPLLLTKSAICIYNYL